MTSANNPAPMSRYGGTATHTETQRRHRREQQGGRIASHRHTGRGISADGGQRASTKAILRHAISAGKRCISTTFATACARSARGPMHEERVLRQWSHAQPQRRRQAPASKTSCRLAAAQGAARPRGRAGGPGRAAAPSIRARTARARLLVGLDDGQTVESVLLPRDGPVRVDAGRLRGRLRVLHDRAATACCARSAAPRSSPRWRWRARQRAVRKVVFMGMGEPAHNLDNVMEAIDLLGTAGGIGHKNLVFSTVGDRARLRAPAARPRQAGAGAVAAHHRRRAARASCCRARRASRPTSWSSWASATRARPATRSSTSGRCWTASTTATDEIDGIVRLLDGKYARAEHDPVQHGRGPDASRGPPGRALPPMARSCTRAAC